MGQSRPLFLHYSSFSQCKHKYKTNLTINYNRVDRVLGTRTWGSRMEGADESTELWWHPLIRILCLQSLGGQEVMIFCVKVKKDDIEIRFDFGKNNVIRSSKLCDQIGRLL